ncbi:dynamin family protein [Tumebacillus flagellatus]|nr:dynamin family protein [Tumebacillus flagellatus]
MEQIEELLERLGNDKLTALGRFLRERVSYPEHFVILLGETSSGKTSLINGMLGQERLTASARPTTGTVIELMDDLELEAEATFRVNEEATLESISRDRFHELSMHPDSNLARLRLMVPQFPHELKGLRLFDTPGYDSLANEHEEVLKDFIPNSDVIVYVVSYRVGFKENDHQFMQYIQNVLQPTTEFVLVVNRVPSDVERSDRRILEIVQHAEDSLHRSLQYFLVPTVQQSPQGPPKPVLPVAADLWEYLKINLLSPQRQEALLHSLTHYQKDLLSLIQQEAEKTLAFAKANQAEKDAVASGIHTFLEQEEQIRMKIKMTFAKLNDQLPRLFNTATERIAIKLQAQIEEANKWTSQDECAQFVQAHSMPLLVRQETKTITEYLMRELERLDAEIESLLNTAVEKFEYEVRVEAPSFEPLMISLTRNVAKDVIGAGLVQFFAQYGGAGGAGAGVANAASHGLKVLGDAFGHTFSRSTHNGLTSFLAKIGATSTRAISAAAIVFVEGAFFVYEALTWQGKLGKAIDRALVEWQQNALSGSQESLTELEEHNYQNFHEYFTAYREAFAVSEVEEEEEVRFAIVQQILLQTQKMIDELDETLQEALV